MYISKQCTEECLLKKIIVSNNNIGKSDNDAQEDRSRRKAKHEITRSQFQLFNEI